MMKFFGCLLLIISISACSETSSHSGFELKFVTIPSGTVPFGANDGLENDVSVFPAFVDSFLLSETEISNRQFEKFVEETGYISDAEKHGGMVFDGEWKLIQSANWRMPEGRKVDRKHWIDLPVVQVSYADAMAYCDWANCRLPSEIEWEYAAKKGKSNSKKMNITSAQSLHASAMNVQSLEPNDLGIYHQSGNVWEWCADVYHYEIYDKLLLLGNLKSRAFAGRSYDPNKLDAKDTLRVIKGGSFLCQAGHCEGYRPASRQSAEQSEAYFHVGFRVAKDVTR